MTTHQGLIDKSEFEGVTDRYNQMDQTSKPGFENKIDDYVE